MLFNLIAAANSGLKNLDQAIENFNKVLEINPKDAMAYFNIGTIFSEKKEFDIAIKNYQKCLAINPNHAETFDNIGSALKAQGSLTAAVEQFTQAINLKPNFTQAHYNLGVALQEKGNFSESITSYENACQIKPNYFKAYLGIGNTLKEQGKVGATIDSYKQALKINPDYADAYHNMGNALQDNGDLDAAIDSYKQALKIKPDYTDAYYNMGISLKNKGELDAAIDSYKQAIKIKPEYAEAYYKLGNALEDKGEIELAIEIYRQSPQITPDITGSPDKFFGAKLGSENFIKNKVPKMTAVSTGSYYFDHFGNEFYEGRLLKVISQLNEIVFQANEEMWGNICYTRKKAQIDFINMFPQQILALTIRRRNIARIPPHIDSIFEIGVNAGHSAVLWLMMNPNIKYFGLDIFNYEYQRSCSHFLKTAFGERFNVFVGDSRIEVPTINEKINQKVDLIHVDGGHSFELANSDLLTSIGVSKKLQTKFILLDDIDDMRVKKAGDEFVAKGILHVDSLGGSWESISNSLFRIS